MSVINTFPFQRPTNHDIWLGMTKDKNSEIWYTVRSTKCIERNFTISGHNHSERQCAILNMSVSSHADTDNMIYADSCDAQLLGFACLVPKGRIPKGKENIKIDVKQTNIRSILPVKRKCRNTKCYKGVLPFLSACSVHPIFYFTFPSVYLN